MDEVFKPISWGIDFGYERFLKKDYIKTKGFVGITFGSSPSHLFAGASPLFLYDSSALFGVGLKVGYVNNSFHNIKFSLLKEKIYYEKDLIQDNFESFVTKQLNKANAIGVKYIYEKIAKEKTDEKVGLYYMYYF